MRFLYKIFSVILFSLCLNPPSLTAPDQPNIASEQLQVLLMILQKREEFELAQKMAEQAAMQAQKDANYKAAQKIEEEQKYFKKKRLFLLFFLLSGIIAGKIYYDKNHEMLKAVFHENVTTPCRETYNLGKKKLEDSLDSCQAACNEKVAAGQKYAQEKVDAARKDIRDTVRETITDPIHRHCTIEGNVNKLTEWGKEKYYGVKTSVTGK